MKEKYIIKNNNELLSQELPLPPLSPRGGDPKKIYITLLALLFLLCHSSLVMSAPLHQKKHKEKKPAPQMTVPTEFLENPHQFVKALHHAPFPYFGEQGEDHNPFFKKDSYTGELFHLTGDGKRYPQSTYQNDKVNFYFPSGFDPRKSWRWVIYLHGHLTVIESHLQEQEILKQAEEAQQNIIFVAPSFAVNASDSSPGKFYQAGAFKIFIEECKKEVELYLKEEGIKFKSLANQKIILMSYSGGYKALAYILDRGGVSENITAILQLDSLYGEIEKFEKFFAHFSAVTWVNLYTSSSAASYEKIKSSFKKRQIPFFSSLPEEKNFEKGKYLIEADANHLEFPQKGPPYHPITYFLKGLATSSFP